MQGFKIRMVENRIDEFVIAASSKEEAIDKAIRYFESDDFEYSDSLKSDVSFYVVVNVEELNHEW